MLFLSKIISRRNIYYLCSASFHSKSNIIDFREEKLYISIFIFCFFAINLISLKSTTMRANKNATEKVFSNVKKTLNVNGHISKCSQFNQIMHFIFTGHSCNECINRHDFTWKNSKHFQFIIKKFIHSKEFNENLLKINQNHWNYSQIPLIRSHFLDNYQHLLETFMNLDNFYNNFSWFKVEIVQFQLQHFEKSVKFELLNRWLSFAILFQVRMSWPSMQV